MTPAGGVAMNSFHEHHSESIRFHYRCFDRILLNGLIQPFQQPERVVGFFNTYRQLYPVSRDVLRAIAEQFQHWLKGWAETRAIPVVEAPKGRRDEFVDSYFKRAKPDQVVVILKAREPARIMTAVGYKQANGWHGSHPSLTPASGCRPAVSIGCSSPRSSSATTSSSVAARRWTDSANVCSMPTEPSDSQTRSRRSSVAE